MCIGIGFAFESYSQDSSIRPAFDMEYDPNVVEFNQGAAWLWNNPERCFYFTVYSDNVGGTSNPHVFLVDNKIFRAFLYNPEEAIPMGEIDSARTDNIFREYIKGRMEVFGANQEVGSPKLRMRKLMGNRWTMEWSFPTPNNEFTIGHAFLSTICFNRILTLNRPLRQGEDLGAARIWLRKTANTLEQKDESIGPKALKDRLEGNDMRRKKN